ncbi:MAG: nucleotidyltransferase family protein, partial [bacterium]
HLAEVVYGDIALRRMADMDLLVKKGDLSRVEEKLLEIGYTPHEDNAQFAEDCSHFVYLPPPESLPVEVHWNIQGLTRFRNKR